MNTITITTICILAIFLTTVCAVAVAISMVCGLFGFVLESIRRFLNP